MLPALKDPTLDSVAGVMKALGDKNRLHILSLLSRKELCVCEITAICHLSQSNVSQHLAKLRSTGLVNERKNAQWVYYSVNKKDFPFLEEVIKLLPEPTEELSKIDALRNHSICKL